MAVMKPKISGIAKDLKVDKNEVLALLKTLQQSKERAEFDGAQRAGHRI